MLFKVWDLNITVINFLNQILSIYMLTSFVFCNSFSLSNPNELLFQLVLLFSKSLLFLLSIRSWCLSILSPVVITLVSSVLITGNRRQTLVIQLFFKRIWGSRKNIVASCLWSLSADSTALSDSQSWSSDDVSWLCMNLSRLLLGLFDPTLSSAINLTTTTKLATQARPKFKINLQKLTSKKWRSWIIHPLSKSWFHSLTIITIRQL